jgi:ribonucleoside-triphosphate reductase (formate)
MLSSKLVQDYIYKKDWRVKENSNSSYSFGALNKYLSSEVSKDYWLRSIYNEKITEAYRRGFIHIHDLSSLTLYCCGYSIRNILEKGIKGVPNIPSSKPAKHFMSALNQIANLTTIFQNEIAGAVAFNNFDTLLSPYIKEDKLSYLEVKQFMQNFIFSINSNSRAGAEPSFSNITFDLTPDKDMLNKPVIYGGKFLDYTYKECQNEMNMINRAFFEIMISGDSEGNPFGYPIPTYNINKRFDWDNPNNDLLWEMCGKYGTPYFANFINSDMDPSDARSMCCRLRIDLSEIRRRGGGLFGSGDSTGSLGVVTINLPRIAHLTKNKTDFYKMLECYMEIAKESLEIKRSFLQKDVLERGLIPAFKEYVGTLDNHFNTIGYVGLNEAVVNITGKNIIEEKNTALEILNFMSDIIHRYQVNTKHLFNLEATPAESTTFRLAQKDVNEFGFRNIAVQGTAVAPYYTNSCHIPVKLVSNIRNLFDHQNELQSIHTGGTVVHVYTDGPMSGRQAKSLIKFVCKNYKIPYISHSPLNTICPEHGLLMKSADVCPICGKITRKYQRITGYIRNVDNFNPGKLSEFKDRNQIHVGDVL